MGKIQFAVFRFYFSAVIPARLAGKAGGNDKKV